MTGTPRLIVGASVEVRDRFNDSWSIGFEIDAICSSGYRVRRTHDQALLPDATGDDDVRAVRDRSPWA